MDTFYVGKVDLNAIEIQIQAKELDLGRARCWLDFDGVGLSLVGLLGLCLAFNLVRAVGGVASADGGEVSWFAAFPTVLFTGPALSTIATSVPIARFESSGLRAASVLLGLLLPGSTTFMLYLLAFSPYPV